MQEYSVLLVDDDSKLIELLQNYFKKEGFKTYTAADGGSALTIADNYKPDIIILDLMLPGIDGCEVCRRLRQKSGVPIIMLTAMGDESDRLIGLGIGADDYVTKPFSMRELVARVRALLRRTYENVLRQDAVNILTAPGLELDITRHTLRKRGQLIDLTPIEFSILETFMRCPSQVFNRLQLLENSHGFAFEGYERTIDGHIKNLRRKIENDPKSPRYILTVYGIGYKFGGRSNE